MLSKRFLPIVLLVVACLSGTKLVLSEDGLLERRDQLILEWVLTDEHPIDESIPPEIFRILKKNLKNDKAWQALHRYKSFTDAGSTLMFYRDCFKALEDNPLIFFDRYMTGDEQALFRMADALSHDFSAFQGETFKHTDQVFHTSLDRILNRMVSQTGNREKYIRAYDFLRVSEAQYCHWRSRYVEKQPCKN